MGSDILGYQREGRAGVGTLGYMDLVLGYHTELVAEAEADIRHKQLVVLEDDTQSDDSHILAEEAGQAEVDIPDCKLPRSQRAAPAAAVPGRIRYTHHHHK